MNWSWSVIRRKISKRWATRKPISTANRVERRAALLALLLVMAGPWRYGFAEAAPENHVLTGVLNATLTETPGARPNAIAAGNVALVVESRTENGRSWFRLLVSDGSHGWVAAAPENLRPAIIRPVIDPFLLLEHNPDETPIEASSQIKAGSEPGQVLGASRQSQPPSLEAMRIPERINPAIQPWLWLKFGESSGYAPLDWIAIDWDSSIASDGSLVTALDHLALHGMIRKPFLAPVANLLARAAPKRSAPIYILSDNGAPLRRATSNMDWTLPEMLVRQDAVRDGIDSLIVYAAPDRARLFSFRNGDASPVNILVEEDRPFTSRVETRDLDGDGKPEWLLEVISTYGDGYYSRLWILAGNSVESAVKFTAIPLSRSSGERDGDMEAAWWLDPENRLWIGRAEKRRTAGSCLRYEKQAVVPCGSQRSFAVAVLAGDASFSGARQRWLEWRATVPAGIFPVGEGSDLRWIVGRPFLDKDSARAWTKQQVDAKLVFWPAGSSDRR